jgi:hypothetical protein
VSALDARLARMASGHDDPDDSDELEAGGAA